MTFSQVTLLEDVTALLKADSALPLQVQKFETGQPETDAILNRLNGGQINVVDLGVKRVSPLWREATVGLIVSTRRPSTTDSDALNTSIGDDVERIITATPKPGQFTTGVMGALSKYECTALSPFEESPEVRVREITITYQIFRG